jgi:hypothetical protein
MAPNKHNHIRVIRTAADDTPDIVVYIRQHKEIQDVPERVVHFYTEYSLTAHQCHESAPLTAGNPPVMSQSHT